MDLFVFLAVLAAAACHAGWNALLKLNVEPIVATALVAAASGVVALPVRHLVRAAERRRLALRRWPRWRSTSSTTWRWRRPTGSATSGQVYPIARGTAPLMTAGLATLWLGEALGPYGWAGVIVLAAGILLLAVRGGRALEQLRCALGRLRAADLADHHRLHAGRRHRRARCRAPPLQYTVWLFLLSGARHGRLRLRPHRPRLVGDFAANWQLALAGAALSTAAYAIAIWAMTVAPIALVAALRETSVLFAALFGMAAAARAACCRPASPPPAWCWPASCWCGCA